MTYWTKEKGEKIENRKGEKLKKTDPSEIRGAKLNAHDQPN